MDYWFRSKESENDEYIAVLLLEKPDAKQLSLLELLNIGVLWFDAEDTVSCTEWQHVSSWRE